MRTLSFLDMSQNTLRELPGTEGENTFEELDSLTALNLERNLIQTLHADAFIGVRKTLTSLSLLNNLLPDFPTAAVSSLKELRVLDIGFNLLTELPLDAFKGNPSITLLALDGNPLATIPFEALSHLNGTLRGLSLGGRFLHCDCRLAWVINWIRNGDLQVTSRERNPQFCGSPARFRDRGFYSIQIEELGCKKQETTTPGKLETQETALEPTQKEHVGVATVVSADLDDLVATNPDLTKSSTTSTTTKQPTSKTTITTSTSVTTTTTRVSTGTTKQGTTSTTTVKPKLKGPSNQWNNKSRPSMVLGAGYPSRSKSDESKEVIVKDAFRQDNSVIIKWGSETANILGFRVVYRLFGDKSFKQGPPLEASEREFKIKNVPPQECIIVCVVSLEELTVTPETVPYTQCREVRTVSAAASNMDKITIAASAAICGTIVEEVKKTSRAAQTESWAKEWTTDCWFASKLLYQYSSTTWRALELFGYFERFQLGKAYSTHSQRPRMYTVDQPASLDDMRYFGQMGKKARSIADGQSQNSFSNHSGRYLTANAFPNNLLASRQGNPANRWRCNRNECRQEEEAGDSPCPPQRDGGNARQEREGRGPGPAAIAIFEIGPIRTKDVQHGRQHPHPEPMLRQHGQLDRPRHGHLHGPKPNDKKRPGASVRDFNHYSDQETVLAS
ncbi:unnamed protein product [Acanthoscelides obtectus]|uniref:Uncharacterized protein n=1 Tax=Acanthoscelides obtectus TaxID=200917 RepID=A0A9P0PX09_ACAOB|nr:unnamed protein product [Acanthoscelides obtectus]CAK1652589.1 Leucine-rich repeat and fibronectin type-III domain-containing protein 5 [Acanthoscelides obtectus]